MFSLGQRMRELRLQKGLTQIELAKDLCTPSMISQIESGRAKPSYKMLFSIAERLDVPLGRLLEDVDLSLEYVSTYKMARAMIGAKEYASAIPLLREVLETPRAQISTIEILFELAVCLLHAGELEEAEQKLSEVLELSVLRRDHQLQAHVRRELGEIEFCRKRYQLAVHHWQKALESAEAMEEQDEHLKAGIQFLLGKCYNQMGHVKEALEQFEHAAALYEGVDDLHHVAHAYLGLAASYQQAMDYAKATEYSERAASILTGIDDLLMTIQLEIHNASLYVQASRVPEAEAMLVRAIQKLDGIGDKEMVGMAYAELAHVYLCRKELEKAEHACHQAQPLLPELHLYQAKVNRTLAGIAQARGFMEEAVHRYHLASDGFKQLGEAFEYDQTMHALSQVYRSQGDFERVADVLEKMRVVTHETLCKRGIAL